MGLRKLYMVGRVAVRLAAENGTPARAARSACHFTILASASPRQFLINSNDSLSPFLCFSQLSIPHLPPPATMADVQDPPTGSLEVATTTQDVAETQPSGAKKVKKIIRKKKRPARPQIDPALIKSEPPPQTGTIFNIWYNKWAGGDREDKYTSQRAAKGRCNIAKDTGYTRADSVTGSYFCLHFARGICAFVFDSSFLVFQLVVSILTTAHKQVLKVKTANTFIASRPSMTCSTRISTVSAATSTAITVTTWAV